MKKILVILSLVAITFNAANAQLFKVFGHDVGFIYVGPKVGMNFSKFSQWSYPTHEVKSRIGYQPQRLQYGDGYGPDGEEMYTCLL